MDIKGIPICRGDVVVCAIEPGLLRFGVVSWIDEAKITVQIICLSQTKKVTPYDIEIPSMQLCLVDISTIQSNVPELDLIKKFHRMYK